MLAQRANAQQKSRREPPHQGTPQAGARPMPRAAAVSSAKPTGSASLANEEELPPRQQEAGSRRTRRRVRSALPGPDANRLATRQVALARTPRRADGEFRQRNSAAAGRRARSRDGSLSPRLVKPGMGLTPSFANETGQVHVSILAERPTPRARWRQLLSWGVATRSEGVEPAARVSSAKPAGSRRAGAGVSLTKLDCQGGRARESPLAGDSRWSAPRFRQRN